MDDYVEISIDVFDQTNQRARVKRSLTVRGLVDEILREFDDLDRKTPQVYGLFLKGNSRPLEQDRSLGELDIANQDELEFKYARRSGREKMEGRGKVLLIEDSTHQVFDLTWQPAVIGRFDSANPAQNELLAVDLDPFPEGRRVSRRHAQITCEGGQYYLEALSANNPTYLNDATLLMGERRRLNSGDRIVIGKSLVALTFLVRE